MNTVIVKVVMNVMDSPGLPRSARNDRSVHTFVFCSGVHDNRKMTVSRHVLCKLDSNCISKIPKQIPIVTRSSLRGAMRRGNPGLIHIKRQWRSSI